MSAELDGAEDDAASEEKSGEAEYDAAQGICALPRTALAAPSAMSRLV